MVSTVQQGPVRGRQHVFPRHVVQLPEDQMADLTAVRVAGDQGLAPLVAQVHRFIDENLADPDLSSSAIAAAHFVSVRQLQKVFESEGGSVTALIRQRRLERCRRDLCDPALRERPIATVAARWGFLDAAHFSRLFRATFGTPPRQYRQEMAG